MPSNGGQHGYLTDRTHTDISGAFMLGLTEDLRKLCTCAQIAARMHRTMSSACRAIHKKGVNPDSIAHSMHAETKLEVK